MNKSQLFVAGIILFALGTAYKNHQVAQKKEAEYQRAVASKVDNCQNKKLCVVVYMAPWCPACKQVMPAVSTLLEKSKLSKEFGTKVYVGKGASQEENEAMAKKLGAGAEVDSNLEMHKKLNVGYYPAFFILDAEGAMTSDGKDAFYWAMERAQ